LSNILQLVFQLIIWIIHLLPNSLLTFVTKRILLLFKYRKQVINKNFKNTNLTSHYKGSFEEFYKKNITFIARIIVESITNVPSNIKEKIVYQNITELESKCQETNGLILLASHYGNWELACSLLPTQTDIQCYGVYKPLKNKAIDQFLIKKRSSHGLILTPMKQIGRTILENKRKNKSAIYILIADQNPNSKNSIEWCSFLGVKTAWFNGPSKLQKKYGFNAAYMEVSIGDKLFDYQIKILKDLKDNHSPDTLLESYSQILENQIIAEPSYWLWSHKRWKRSF